MNKKNESISGWRNFLKRMTKAHDLSNEDELILDHDYDGIKELDNVLPPWWLAGFIITIIISIFYYVMVLGFDEYNQYDELDTALSNAKMEVENYKKENPELFDIANMKAYTDEVNLKEGERLFTAKTCTVCHLVDLGGSIGPNLVDDAWILGGGFENMFTTISKGGRPGKGMIAWEKSLSQQEIRQLTSYIISMQGTTPSAPKESEGEIVWSK